MGRKRKSSDVGLNPKPKRKYKSKKAKCPKSDPYPLEDFLLRHPSLSEAMFDEIDDKNLVKCRTLSNILCNNIDAQRKTWIKMIKRKFAKRHLRIFQEDWGKAFRRTPIEYLKELALTVKNEFKWDSMGNYGIKPLHFAAMSGNLDLYSFISEKVEDKFPIMTSKEFNTPLDFAAEYGHLEIVRYIIQKVVAPENGRLVIQNVFFEGVKVPNTLRSLYYAAKNGHFEVYRYLEDHFEGQNFKENEKKDTINKALWISASNGHLDVFEYIVRNFESTNPVNNDGETPLHSAARNGHLDICKSILLNLGLEDVSNCNPKSKTGETPLHCAAEFGHLEVFEFISCFPGNINPKKKDGSTPLHKAAKSGHIKICEYILPHVKDKNPKGKKGETLLHSIARVAKLQDSKLRNKKIQFEVYKCIAESVENKNPADKLGLTPLHIATKVSKNHYICRYILEQLREEYLSDQKKKKVSVESSGDLEVAKQLFASYCSKKEENQEKKEGSIPLYKQIEDAIGFVFSQDCLENGYWAVDTRRYDALNVPYLISQYNIASTFTDQVAIQIEADFEPSIGTEK